MRSWARVKTGPLRATPFGHVGDVRIQYRRPGVVGYVALPMTLVRGYAAPRRS